MDAIIGNSQAGGAGSVLQSILKSKGRSVSRSYKNGSGNDDLVRQFNGIGKKVDTLYVFGGDDDPAGVAELMGVVGRDMPVMWWGSSPATRISSLSTARKVFGSKVSDDNYWFSSGEAERRENRNRSLRETLSKYPNVKFMDYRQFNVNHSIVQGSGVSWPDQPDGIHISTSTAKDLFSNSDAVFYGEGKSKISLTMIVGVSIFVGGLIAYFRRKV